MDINPSVPLSSKLSLQGDLGFRTTQPSSLNRYYIRPTLRYRNPRLFFNGGLTNPSISAGIGLFYIHHFEENNAIEVRPFQGYAFAWPKHPHFQLSHYARLEERFFMSTTENKSDFGLRMRYRLKAIFTLPGNPISDKNGMYLPFSVEPFFNVNRSAVFNDHMRITPGIGWYFSQKIRSELNLAFHVSGYETRDEAFVTNDMVARLRLFYTLRK